VSKRFCRISVRNVDTLAETRQTFIIGTPEELVMGRETAEQEFDDPALGRSTLGRLFEDSAERHTAQAAQQYKGGVYDRSLAGIAIPEAPADGYETLTYGEMRDAVRRLAAGFRDLGLTADDRMGVFSDTRLEWALCDFGILAAGGVVTTVYKGSSPAQVEYLLDDPGASAVVVENDDCLRRVFEVEEALSLDYYVVVDDPGKRGQRDDVYTLAEVYSRGKEAFDPAAYEDWIDERSPDDLASLVYTSGTTGKPKGVRLTHGNFRANVSQTYRRYGPRADKPPGTSIDPETVTVSYLPLAHVFERLAGHFLIFAAGGTVSYAESVDTLREDFQLFEPTSATSVPRVYEKMYDAIREQAQGSTIRERIFEWALDVGRTYQRRESPSRTLAFKYGLADRLVFSDVREALGENVEFLVSGGGTLSKDLCELYHAMGLPIYEGYGLTEAAPVVTTNPPTDAKPGTIGPPVLDVDLRLDASELPDGYTVEESEEVGELLVDGPNVTDGYWNMPEKTADAFSDDGFLRTGDIVERRDDGYLVFRDRVKQLIVLSTGKNIAPAPIEDDFAAINLIKQVLVLGEDRKFVSALVVPDVEALRWFAESEGIDLPADREALCEDEAAREFVAHEIERVNEALEEHERIKKFRLVPEEFTQENGLLTPTLKKKRRDIHEKYADRIAEMYGVKEFEGTAAD
jgi:long-chain acyl-CoA synthetase